MCVGGATGKSVFDVSISVFNQFCCFGIPARSRGLISSGRGVILFIIPIACSYGRVRSNPTGQGKILKPSFLVGLSAAEQRINTPKKKLAESFCEHKKLPLHLSCSHLHPLRVWKCTCSPPWNCRGPTDLPKSLLFSKKLIDFCLIFVQSSHAPLYMGFVNGGDSTPNVLGVVQA